METYKGCNVPSNLEQYRDKLDMSDRWACYGLGCPVGATKLGCRGFTCLECILYQEHRKHLTTYLETTAMPNNTIKELQDLIEKATNVLRELRERDKPEHKEPELVYVLNDESCWGIFLDKNKANPIKHIDKGVQYQHDDTLYDLILCDWIGNEEAICLGHWNDGPKEG
jgi:hypothetical protein